jgi:hypothetical protein
LTPTIILGPIGQRDVGGRQVNSYKFILTKYTKRPEDIGALVFLHPTLSWLEEEGAKEPP